MTGGGGAEADGTQDIGEKGEQDARTEEDGAGGEPELIQLAKEEGDHQGGLEGPDAAAGFFDSEGAFPQGNEVAAENGRDIEPVKSLECDRCIGWHEDFRD